MTPGVERDDRTRRSGEDTRQVAVGKRAVESYGGIGFSGTLLGLPVQKLADGRDQRRLSGVAAAVLQVEPVVEGVRVPSLVVLENGFQLVERLGQPRFRRAGLLVLVPKAGDLRPQTLRKGAEQEEQVFPLPAP